MLKRFKRRERARVRACVRACVSLSIYIYIVQHCQHCQPSVFSYVYRAWLAAYVFYCFACGSIIEFVRRQTRSDTPTLLKIGSLPPYIVNFSSSSYSPSSFPFQTCGIVAPGVVPTLIPQAWARGPTSQAREQRIASEPGKAANSKLRVAADVRRRSPATQGGVRRRRT